MSVAVPGLRAALSAALSSAAALMLCACVLGGGGPAANSSDAAQQLWQSRVAQLSTLNRFKLHGRLAGRGLIAVRGDLNWVQSGKEFDVRFFGPLGIGAVALNGQPRDLVVRTKDGALRTSDPEAYMQQQLGWSLPIAGLRWWVLGIPAPGSAPRVQIDEQGRALSLDQDGWHIDYSEYQTFGERPVPRKIELASAERGFRLVIDQWLELASTQ